MRISDLSSDVCSSYLFASLSGNNKVDTPTGTHLIQPEKIYLTANDAAADLSIDLSFVAHVRSEERRVGKECVSTCRSGWWTDHKKKKRHKEKGKNEKHTPTTTTL